MDQRVKRNQTTLPFLPPAHRRKGFNKGYVTARSRDALGKIPMSKEIQRGVFKCFVTFCKIRVYTSNIRVGS